MAAFPFVSLKTALIVLRISLAIVFLAHAIVRILGGTINQFAGFLNAKGLMIGHVLVWSITVFELAGGVLLALGYFTKWLSAGFIGMLLVGIVLIHAGQGWFVGEHGTGGVEYSFILIVAFLVVAAADNKSARLLKPF